MTRTATCAKVDIVDGASTPLTYRLVVKGRMSDRLSCTFDGLTVEPRAGETELVGDFVDQSQLYGLIDRLRDLGIELVSVNAGR